MGKNKGGSDKKQQKQGGGQKQGGKKKETGLVISAKKSENFSEWYSQVITQSEMIDYHDISGCYILRPWAYGIWEEIQGWLDGEMKKIDIENSYFPLFVSKAALCAEEDHIEGFAPEVAWVTKSGQSDLKEPIAVRPTSETIMYPAYARWIRSHRDLPMRLNQWANVVRWEFKNPTPFLRTREFLWQEGHTAHATCDQATEQVMQILELYARVYEEVLCVPVIKGRKSEKEKFAGALFTTTVEALIPMNGRAIQGATSHNLGQNFAKMFNISFETEDKKREFIWQTSFGLTTRTIGVAIMVHGDDKGLVLPPKVAKLQLVLVWIYHSKEAEETREALFARARSLEQELKGAGVRAKLDDRMDRTPGWKYAHWEQKGVPLRLELGPKDMEKSTCVLVRRDTGEKITVAWEGLGDTVTALLQTIQEEMLDAARRTRDSQTSYIETFEEMVPALDRKHIIMAPWCERIECEEDIKERTGPQAADLEGKTEEEVEEISKALSGSAKSLCVPFEQEALPEGTSCFACTNAARVRCMFGRSY